MHGNKKILIIDDEIDLCLLLKDYFLRKNYEVIVANTLSEGNMLLNTIHPDILFLDNNLTDGLGWDIAPAVVANFPAMFIVMISAFHPAVPKMPEGARYSIIEKPITLADLDNQFLRISEKLPGSIN